MSVRLLVRTMLTILLTVLFWVLPPVAHGFSHHPPDGAWGSETHEQLVSPFQVFEDLFKQRWTDADLNSHTFLTAGAISLIDYIKSHIEKNPRSDLEAEVPRYNRRKHFGGWVNANPEENCLDTRNEVLVRDAIDPRTIKFRDKRSCFVARAHWKDPYTGYNFKLASAVQVDHVVPLREAYYSGGYDWTPARRCHFSNYIENQYHLRTVSGHENMSKGQRGPDAYMPPNDLFHCQYLHEWMKVKAVWRLTVTKSEHDAILAILREKRCKSAATLMSQEEFLYEKEKAKSPTRKCLQFESRIESGSGFEPGLESDDEYYLESIGFRESSESEFDASEDVFSEAAGF